MYIYTPSLLNLSVIHSSSHAYRLPLFTLHFPQEKLCKSHEISFHSVIGSSDNLSVSAFSTLQSPNMINLSFQEWLSIHWSYYLLFSQMCPLIPGADASQEDNVLSFVSVVLPQVLPNS